LQTALLFTRIPTFFSAFTKLAGHINICGAYLFVFALKWKQKDRHFRHFFKQRLADNFDSKASTSIENYSYEHVYRMNCLVCKPYGFPNFFTDIWNTTLVN
jgi:hypothetical protein